MSPSAPVPAAARALLAVAVRARAELFPPAALGAVERALSAAEAARAEPQEGPGVR